ncbi:hypothetical protein MP638_001599 [Amoeboaphelidium occidentale]|nr:hypothetical protein MP638_001599 [Amoeboaphelidium occidentale]
MLYLYFLLALVCSTAVSGLTVSSDILSKLSDEYRGLISNQTVNEALNIIRAPNQTRVKNKYIVKLKDDVPMNLFKTVAGLLQNLLGAEIVHELQHVFKGFAINVDIDLPLDLLRRIPYIDYVEEDRMMYSTQVQNLNDQLWGLDALDNNINQSYKFTLTGKGVNVYILDSGIDEENTEFGSRGRPVYTARFLQNSPRGDCTGHGTHVAGIIGGTNVGVAKLANLLSLRVIGCQDESLNSEIVAAIDWITANHVKPAIINMSLGPKQDQSGIYPRSEAMDRSIQAAANAGIVFVVAAGNDNMDCCRGSPAGSPGAIPVASSNQRGFRSSFSNYGPCVKFFAPGNDILSSKPGGGYQMKRGTSQAAPFVAGVAALYMEQNPRASPSDVVNALQAISVKGIIQDSQTAPNIFLQAFAPNLPNTDNLVRLSPPTAVTDGAKGIDWQNLSRTIGFVVGGLAVAGLIFGGGWWLKKKIESNEQAGKTFAENNPSSGTHFLNGFGEVNGRRQSTKLQRLKQSRTVEDSVDFGHPHGQPQFLEQRQVPMMQSFDQAPIMHEIQTKNPMYLNRPPSLLSPDEYVPPVPPARAKKNLKLNPSNYQNAMSPISPGHLVDYYYIEGQGLSPESPNEMIGFHDEQMFPTRSGPLPPRR